MKITKAKDSHQSAATQPFNKVHWLLPIDDSMGFVNVAAGEFLMGSYDISEDEGPLHLVNLPEFWISKYPVTFAQFRVFVEECEAMELDAGISLSPENHPVVFVSWVEALRYCVWLNEKLVEFSITQKCKSEPFLGFANGNFQVTLPSESEWEKAARGIVGQVYPWGDEFGPLKLNIDETGIGSTSPVGSFPLGASPYGILDMAGNVWEWTRSIMGEWDAEKLDLASKYKYPYNSGVGREILNNSCYAGHPYIGV